MGKTTTVAFVCCFVVSIASSAQDSDDGSGDDGSGEGGSGWSAIPLTPILTPEGYPCPRDYVRAADGVSCLSKSTLCNTFREYIGGIDEDKDLCEKYSCPERQTKVNKTVCYWTSSLCDGMKEIGIDEDREFCQSFRCPVGKIKLVDNVTCLYTRYVCDGKDDYGLNGVDEDKGFCETFHCPIGSTKLSDNVTCLNNRDVCDGRDTFGHLNGIDEDPVFCEKFTCTKWSTKVNNKTCIKTYDLCNGKKLDFLDGLDEDKTFCETFECPSPMKKCEVEKGVRDYPQCKYSCSPPPSWSGSNRGRWAPHFLPALSSKWRSSIMREHFGGNVRKAQVPAVDKKTAATLEEIRQYMQAAKRKAQ